jgi:hypothetical protein
VPDMAKIIEIEFSDCSARHKSGEECQAVGDLDCGETLCLKLLDETFCYVG